MEVRLLTTEAGGRRSAIQTDYRPDWDVGNTWLGIPTINGGRLFLEDRNELAPGEQGLGRIDPLVPELWGRLRVGSLIAAQEGSRIVGYARILEIFDCPAYWSPEVGQFVDQANQFCELVERAGEWQLEQRLVRAQERLLELYRAAQALPRVKPIEGDDVEAKPPRPSINFDTFDFYYVIFDPYRESEAVGGSLADDFLDIYGDVKAGLEHWKNEAARTNAIWHWGFTFDAHWGRHAINALYAMHHARNPLR